MKIELSLYNGQGFVNYVDHLGSDKRIVDAARISYMGTSRGEEHDKKLLKYLYEHKHTSPFEQCSITFHIKMPIFIMRQFVRHRTFRLNEISARYSELPESMYRPTAWRKQDIKNKQGSFEDSFNEVKQDINRTLENAYDFAYTAYRELLANGVAKELARIVLPVGTFTEIFVNIDLNNLIKFFKLRLDSHAQLEIQELAQAMFQIFKQLFPWTAELYEQSV